MKVGRDYSWFVSFSWKYEYFDEDENEWLEEDCFSEGRFDCNKMDIKKVVTKYIEEYELQGERYRNLIVEISDFYKTTTEEV